MYDNKCESIYLDVCSCHYVLDQQVRFHHYLVLKHAIEGRDGDRADHLVNCCDSPYHVLKLPSHYLHYIANHEGKHRALRLVLTLS